MSEDIVKRLREGDITVKCDDGVVRYANHVAADTIEALRDEVERLSKAHDERLKQNSLERAATHKQYHRAEKAEAEAARLKGAITTHIAGCVACGGSGAVFLCPERDDTTEAIREDCEECYGLRKALAGETT